MISKHTFAPNTKGLALLETIGETPEENSATTEAISDPELKLNIANSSASYSDLRVIMPPALQLKR